MRQDPSAHDDLGRGRNHRLARAVNGLTALDVVLHHHRPNQHDGGGHTTEEKSNNSKSATVSHYPLPRGPPDLFCRPSINFRSTFRVNFCLMRALPLSTSEVGRNTVRSRPCSGVAAAPPRRENRVMSCRLAFSAAALTGALLCISEPASAARGMRAMPGGFMRAPQTIPRQFRAPMLRPA